MEKLKRSDVPAFGDSRITFAYYSDESTPAEPNHRADDGSQLLVDEKALFVDGVQAFSFEAPAEDMLSDRELYDAYLESLKT